MCKIILTLTRLSFRLVKERAGDVCSIRDVGEVEGRLQLPFKVVLLKHDKR